MSPKRRTAYRAALLVLPLVAFAMYAALNWFVIEDDKEWRGANVEARRDPYLAYKRLLAKLGSGARFTDQTSSLDSPPEKGTVILASRRLVYMTRSRLDTLTSWVDRGGTLVLEAEPPGIDDPLLNAFGVEVETPEPEAGPVLPRRSARAQETLFDWRGSGDPLRVLFGRGRIPLRETALHPDVNVAASGGDIHALAFPWGDGRVVALATFAPFTNASISTLDHAELAWQLAANGRDHGGTILFLKPPEANLVEWLEREAWPVLIAAGLLLVAWLARIVPRFGPLAPDPQPVRRRLVEHIAASGRFLWSRGEKTYLLDAARERTRQAIARRFTRTSPLDMQRVLAAKADTDAAFVDAMAALRDIESRLGRPRAAKLSPRELA